MYKTKKKIAKGWTTRFLPPVLHEPCGPTLILGVHGIDTYAQFFILKKPYFNLAPLIKQALSFLQILSLSLSEYIYYIIRPPPKHGKWARQGGASRVGSWVGLSRVRLKCVFHMIFFFFLILQRKQHVFVIWKFMPPIT